MKNTVLRVIAVKRHVSSFEQSEKKGKEKKRGEGPRTSTITKLLHQTRATFFTAVHSLSISVTDLADSRSSTAFFLFCPDYGTPLNLCKSSLLFENSQNKAKKHLRFRQLASHRASLAPPPPPPLPLESGLLMDSVK